MSGVPIKRGKFVAYTLAGPARRDRRPVPHLLHLYGRGGLCERQRLHAVLDRRGGARRRVAVRRHGQRHRRDLRRASPSAPSATCSSSSTSTRCGSRCSRASCCCSPSASAPSRCSACGTGWSGSDERRRHDRPLRRRGMPSFVRSVDPAVATAFACIIAAAARRQPLFDELPVAGISAAAAQGRVVPRRHRHRHDAGHPARPDRPLGALGGDGRRHDGLRGGRLSARSASRWRFPSASSAASRSASSTASASPICASPR